MKPRFGVSSVVETPVLSIPGCKRIVHRQHGCWKFSILSWIRSNHRAASIPLVHLDIRWYILHAFIQFEHLEWQNIIHTLLPAFASMIQIWFSMILGLKVTPALVHGQQWIPEMWSEKQLNTWRSKRRTESFRTVPPMSESQGQKIKWMTSNYWQMTIMTMNIHEVILILDVIWVKKCCSGSIYNLQVSWCISLRFCWQGNTHDY